MKSLTYLTLALFLTSGPVLASSNRENDDLLYVDRVFGLSHGCFTTVTSTLAPALTAYASGCSCEEREQFLQPLAWYRPTPDELTFLSSLGFEKRHLGAALRFRKFINGDNAPLIQKMLKGTTWRESLELMPATLGLSPDILEEAALIPAFTERLAFLENAPREDAWVYGMLGADCMIDDVLEKQIKARLEKDADYVSALLIRNLMEGSAHTRMRLTGFLLHCVYAHNTTPRYQLLGYGEDAHVVRTLHMKKSIPNFGIFVFDLDRTTLDPGQKKFSTRVSCPNATEPMPIWTYTPSSYLKPIMSGA